MNYIDLFSGIGGFALGAYWAGLKVENHYFSEVDPYCVQLYRERFPESIPLGDISAYENWALPDGEYIVSGGFPCTPFSVAGKQRGEEDDRYLWPAMFGVIQKVRPRWVVCENVTAIDGMVLESVLSDLESAGYETAPPLEIPAVAVGCYGERYRTWIIAYADGERADQWSNNERHSNEWSMEAHDQEGRAPRSRVSRRLVRTLWREEAVPDFLRSDYVLPDRVDRVRALGNAIVPQIAEQLFRAIITAEYER